MRKNPDIPSLPKLGVSKWTKDFAKTTWSSLPGLCMPFIILGGIYSGLMTTTESAAVAAVYALVIGVFVFREIKLRELRAYMSNAGITTGVIMCNVFFIMVFSSILLRAGLPHAILELMLSVTQEKWVLLMMINLFMIILGMIMDDTCATLLVATILTPIVTELGVSPYQL